MESLRALYLRIADRARKLLEIGAISKAGKPPSNPEDVEINRGWRAWDRAIEELPTDQKRELDNRLNINERDVLGPMRSEFARARAGARRLQQSRSGGIADPGLNTHNHARAITKAKRLEAVAAAIICVEGQGHKPTAKRITQHVNAAGFAASVDTIRKDLAKSGTTTQRGN